MKNLILIVSLLFSLDAQSQDSKYLVTREDSIKYLTKLMVSDGRLTSIGTGFVGAPSKQYHRFVFLLAIMDTTELVQLVKNSKGCLKIYAFMGLHHNKYTRVREAQDVLKDDATKLLTISGCTVEVTSVADAVNRITDWYWEERTDNLLTKLLTNKEFRAIEFNDISSLDK